jgi:hypothetical protein
VKKEAPKMQSVRYGQLRKIGGPAGDSHSPLILSTKRGVGIDEGVNQEFELMWGRREDVMAELKYTG